MRWATRKRNAQVELSMRVELPESLQGIFFDFLWETSKAWALPTETTVMSLDALSWHLRLSVWSTVRGQPRFDLAPATVLRTPDAFPEHWRKILAADLSYPLEMFRNGQRWVVLDGYHRLARHHVEGIDVVRVRLHPDEHKDAIRRQA